MPRPKKTQEEPTDIREIQFNPNINHIIKYKTGTCLYILDRLTYGSHDKNAPLLKFVHATKDHSNYHHCFRKNELFSDRFEFVDWGNLPLDDRRNIISFNKWHSQVDEEYLKVFGLIPRYPIDDIDERIYQMGLYLGTHKSRKFNEKGEDVETMLNDLDLSGYATICADNTVPFSANTSCIITTDGTTDSGLYNKFYGMEYDDGEKKSYEDVPEPIVYKSKKKRPTMVALEVDETRILK